MKTFPREIESITPLTYTADHGSIRIAYPLYAILLTPLDTSLTQYAALTEHKPIAGSNVFLGYIHLEAKQFQPYTPQQPITCRISENGKSSFLEIPLPQLEQIQTLDDLLRIPGMTDTRLKPKIKKEPAALALPL